MKSIAFLLTVLLVALVSTVAQGANPADYIKPTDLRKACLKKDGGNNVVAAIDKFCKNTNIVRNACKTYRVVIRSEASKQESIFANQDTLDLGRPRSHRRQRSERRSQGPICVRQDLRQVFASAVGAAEVLLSAVVLHVLEGQFARVDGEVLREEAVSGMGD